MRGPLRRASFATSLNPFASSRTMTMTILHRTLGMLAGLTLALAPAACVVEHGGGWDEPLSAPPVGNDDPVEPGDDPIETGDGDGDGDAPINTGDGDGDDDDLVKFPGTPGDDVDDPEPEAPTMMESARGNLVWKRYRQLERDLMRALELTKEQVCEELGQFNCVDVVHLAPLGGNEPFDQGQYEPVAAPTASTPIAVDRVVLSACIARVEEDQANNPEVFTDVDLNSSALSITEDAAAIDATVTSLYRRFHSRNPTDAELDAARALGDGGSGVTFAKTACYAVGSTVEMLFY